MQNLTEDEIKLVIEALLFAGSVQVFSEHTDEQSKKMVDIAKKLYINKDIELNNIYFLVENDYEESYATDIIQSFPNVPQVTINEILK